MSTPPPEPEAAARAPRDLIQTMRDDTARARVLARLTRGAPAAVLTALYERAAPMTVEQLTVHTLYSIPATRTAIGLAVASNILRPVNPADSDRTWEFTEMGHRFMRRYFPNAAHPAP